MLSTLLLSFACAAPAQEPVAPLVDSFPADSLITVELSLEPWDRLRKQTSAHILFRDRNILKRAIAVASPLGDEDAKKEIRAALGSVRVILAATPQSLEMGGVLIAVEPANFGAAAYDWASHLEKFTGVPTQKLGNGYLTLLQEPGSFGPEAAAAYLSKLSQAATTGEGTLGMHAGWKPLHRTQLTGDDLARVTIPGWNWNEQSLLPIANMMEPGQAGIVSRVLASMVELFGLQHGVAFKTSIRGSEIIDSYFLPRAKAATTVLASIGTGDDAFKRFEALPAGDGAAFLGGVNAGHAVTLFRKAIDSVLAELGMAIEDEPVAVQAFAALQACAAQLGPEMVSLSSLETMQEMQMGSMQLAVRDRAALEAAWKSMPEEITSLLPIITAQSGGSFPMAKLDEQWLHMNSATVPPGGKPLSSSAEYQRIREQAKRYVEAGDQVIWINFAPASFSEQIWTMADETLNDLGGQFGFEYKLGPIRPDDRKALGPAWGVMKRTERGIESVNHSSFGNQLFGSFVGIKAALDAQGDSSIDEFDEEEF
jgi:hypothetical protein